MGLWKLMAAPAAVPVAFSLVVALAGPGGPVEVENNHGPVSSPASISVAPPGEGVSADVAPPDPGAATGEIAQPSGAAATAEPPAAADATAGSNGGPGCVEALTEHAKSKAQLEEHIEDPEKPAGGASGNQNALDHQCGGAFASDSGAGETVDADEPEQAPAGASPGADSGNGNGNGNGNANGHDKPADKPAGGNGR